MSSGLFKSRQIKSKRNLKKLSISAPISNNSFIDSIPPTPTSIISNNSTDYPVIILKSKYHFEPVSSRELEVNVDEYLKLIDRPGNGWLLVKYLDKFNNQSGLIPASYVDIAVNDLINPISHEWLNEIYDKFPRSDEEEKKELIETNYKQAKNVKSYPIKVDISQVLQNSSSRIWYRVDLNMSNDTKIYIGKHYQDFYDLHIKLSTKNNEILPKLPSPIKSRGSNGQGGELLLNRINQLNDYFSKLIKIDLFRNEIGHFINDETRKYITNNDIKNNDFEINETIYPNSINISNSSSPSSSPHLSNSSNFFSPTAPLPPPSSSPSSPTSAKNYHLSSNKSNEKYSTYMKQSSPSSPTCSPKSRMVESNSSNTLSSFTSLIEGYDEDTSESSIEETSAFPERQKSCHDKKDSITSNKSEIESVFSLTPSAQRHDSQSSAGNSIPPTPHTPILEDDHEFDHGSKVIYSPLSPNSSNINKKKNEIHREVDYIKIKIVLNNEENDIIAIKIKKTNLISIVYLKKLLSFKIYKDYNLISHYNLLLEGETLMSDEDLLNYLKSHNKVSLRLARSRNC